MKKVSHVDTAFYPMLRIDYKVVFMTNNLSHPVLKEVSIIASNEDDASNKIFERYTDCHRILSIKS